METSPVDPLIYSSLRHVRHLQFHKENQVSKKIHLNPSDPSIGVGIEEGRLPLDRTILLLRVWRNMLLE